MLHFLLPASVPEEYGLKAIDSRDFIEKPPGFLKHAKVYALEVTQQIMEESEETNYIYIIDI